MERVGRGLAERGVTVVTFEFPYMEAGRRLPDRGPVLEDAFRAAWRAVVGSHDGQQAAALFVGGKSMGGRIATQVAATPEGFSPRPAGIVTFGYPLHPPGKPRQRRDRHLPRISIPVLFVHGTRDPFGSPDEMRALARSLPNTTLFFVEQGDHSLGAPKREDPSGHSITTALDAAAAWIRDRQLDMMPA